MSNPIVQQLRFTRLEFHRSICNIFYRIIYHYWYHLGENLAIRQQLGYTELPQFVGAIDKKTPYTPEC